MAFPYYPATYQPMQQGYYQPQQNLPPTQMSGANQMMTPPQVSNVWVYSRAEVDGYPVAPNAAVRLWDSNEPVFYLKQADASGRPSVKVFDYRERVETAPAPAESTPAYVTKSELEAALEALRGELKKEAAE